MTQTHSGGPYAPGTAANNSTTTLSVSTAVLPSKPTSMPKLVHALTYTYDAHSVRYLLDVAHLPLLQRAPGQWDARTGVWSVSDEHSSIVMGRLLEAGVAVNVINIMCEQLHRPPSRHLVGAR